MSSDDPYSPPKAEVSAPEQARSARPRPRQVLWAVSLLWLTFALAFVTMGIEWEREPELFSDPFGVLFIAALMAFSAWLNIAVWQGWNWARIVTLVFTLLNVALYLVPGAMPAMGLDAVIALFSTVCSVVAMVFVFTQPGTSWFQAANDGDALS